MTFRLLLTTIILTLISANSLAEQLYVKDQLFAPMRSGPSNGHRVIHAGIPSGSALQKLDSQGDYTQVKTDSGKTGWLRTDYLSPQRIAKDLLKDAQAKIELLSKGQKPLIQRMDQLEQEHEENSIALEKALAENQILSKQLEHIKTNLFVLLGPRPRHGSHGHGGGGEWPKIGEPQL